MKKVLLVLIAVFMAVPAFAIEVYNNGEGNSVDIYGTLRGYAGYGWADGSVDMSNVTIREISGSDMIYGIQGNSRLGVKLKIGNFSGQVEIGANEVTIYGSGANNIGLRQAWGAYSFGNAGSLLAGKTDTPTSMSGFSSDVFDTDSGFNGFGGNGTSNRRFQVQYNVAGVSIAIIENDMAANAKNMKGLWTGIDEQGNPYTKNISSSNVIPRIGISYTYKNPSLLAKVAATYSAYNGQVSDSATIDNRWATIHAFGIVAGVKPMLLDGKLWIAVQGRYGMNEDLYGEAKTAYSNGGFATNSCGITATINTDGSVDNVQRGNIMLEIGYNIVERVAIILGGGWQGTFTDVRNSYSGTYDLHSYGVYLQAPIKLSANFSIIPQVSWYGNSAKDDDANIDYSNNGILAGAQLRFTF